MEKKGIKEGIVINKDKNVYTVQCPYCSDMIIIDKLRCGLFVHAVGEPLARLGADDGEHGLAAVDELHDETRIGNRGCLLFDHAELLVLVCHTPILPRTGSKTIGICNYICRVFNALGGEDVQVCRQAARHDRHRIHLGVDTGNHLRLATDRRGLLSDFCSIFP